MLKVHFPRKLLQKKYFFFEFNHIYDGRFKKGKEINNFCIKKHIFHKSIS